MTQPSSRDTLLKTASLLFRQKGYAGVGLAEILAAADLAVPQESAFRSTGRQGVHSEHMGYILAEMQHLQRSYPGGVW